ncbi:MAG TPA: TlyA family RNA methyltransferase [Vicinamibacterales bacterium]|nr:TlyA family RNA methyltransferase [Vicinamibacterales bacterium]
MPPSRLDQLLVVHGLAASRERARALILAGDVLVDGVPATKAGQVVRDGQAVALRQPDHPWASRGGLKLDHALGAFGLDVTDRLALDIGASTGGFTDVLLARGARRVVALDVGRGQIDWRLRSDPRVVTIEGVNARRLAAADLPEDARLFDLITIDVSFISLRHILPALPPLIRPNGRVLALVKPQFEAGRHEVGAGGIVRDAAVHTRVVAEVSAEALRVGLEPIGVTPSPIEGAHGNREFFLLARPIAP